MNVLKGKKIVFNGDSICQGVDEPGGYGKYIADRNEMQYQNIGIGGGTIAKNTTRFSQSQKRDVPRHCICGTIQQMDADADYAIVEGGVNDASLDTPVPLGAISDGYSAELDETTFYGAFESMLRQLIIRFEGKKIGYIAVHKMTPGYTAEGAAPNYYHAAKECCAKWGVPFLDLNTSVPPFRYFEADGLPELYALRQKYTCNGDGWHPNREGYLKYYCDKIEAWLKTL